MFSLFFCFDGKSKGAWDERNEQTEPRNYFKYDMGFAWQFWKIRFKLSSKLFSEMKIAMSRTQKLFNNVPQKAENSFLFYEVPW